MGPPSWEPGLSFMDAISSCLSYQSDRKGGRGWGGGCLDAGLDADGADGDVAVDGEGVDGREGDAVAELGVVLPIDGNLAKARVSGASLVLGKWMTLKASRSQRMRIWKGWPGAKGKCPKASSSPHRPPPVSEFRFTWAGPGGWRGERRRAGGAETAEAGP